MSRFTVSSAVFVASLLSLPVCNAAVSIERVDVGFERACRAGDWTPLVVAVAVDGSAPESVLVETVSTDADGTLVRRTSPPLKLQRVGSEHVVRTVFQSGRAASGMTVRLLDPSGTTLAETRLPDGTPLLSTLSKDAVLWVVADEFAKPVADDGSPVVPLPETVVSASLGTSLPSDPLAFDSVDVLMIRGDFDASADEADGLRRWVAGGGHLAIGLGRFTDEFRRGELAKWMPVEVGETTQLRDLSALENFPRSARIRIARLDGGDSRFPQGLDTPLTATAAYGFGRVTLFAMDLDTQPFATWSGLADLLGARLLDDASRATRTSTRTTPGVSDLSTQLIRSEDAFPGVVPRSVGVVLLLLLLLAVVVGPLDYLLVHRVLRRPLLTWLTLPVIVALVSTWLYRSASASNGIVSQFRELHIVDVEAETGTVRGRTDVAVYAADSLRVDLDVTPFSGSEWGATPGDTPATRLAWLAPPEETLGGTYREASGSLFHPEYRIAPPSAIAQGLGVPMPVWSGRHFAATWQRSAAQSLVVPSLVSAGRGRLDGSIRHRLAGPLTNILLAFEDHAYVSEDGVEWYPGDPLPSLTSQFRRQDLSGMLTRQTTTQVERKPGEGGESYVVTESSYNPAGTDLAEIVTMLTFHAAAGGRGYTGLTNTERASDDLSLHLKSGRAVLLAQLSSPASAVAVADADGTKFERVSSTTFVRFVLSVNEPADRSDAFVPLAPTDKSSQPNPAGERPPRP
jgi:hypothetical protein